MDRRYRVQVRIFDEESGLTADEDGAYSETLRLPLETARIVYSDILNAYKKAHEKELYTLV